jgi:SAM-dependent methyltransferase
MPCGCQTPVRMASIVWGRELAEVYDRVYASESEPAMLEPVLDILSDLAMGGGALEFAVGTGRVALPLSARGVPVRGLELSPHMVDQLLAKPGADIVPVTTGDMITTRVPGTYRLVYLVANTLMNVTTQDEQLAVFENAAAHLEAGGCFVVELPVPQLPSVPRGEIGRVFTLEAEHVGIETFDDLVEQVAWSHHWMGVEGRLLTHAAPYRYVWPSELVLMAKLAGLRLRDRWADWHRAPFTATSTSQVASSRRPATVTKSDDGCSELDDLLRRVPLTVRLAGGAASLRAVEERAAEYRPAPAVL